VRLAERVGFERAVASADAVIHDPDVSVVVIATPHDMHAALASEALRAGKHVFCEKPLALTDAELDGVEDAWKASGCQLYVGFNRRFSPAVLEARRRLDAIGAPAVITYRVNAGPILSGHWYGDRRQGGRLLGEVCHFIDTCSALTGHKIINVTALTSSTGEAGSGNDIAMSMRLGNGSLATISYASGGHPGTPKEHVQILSGGHTIVIDDFKSLIVDDSTAWSGTQDKGHRALMSSFAKAVRGGRGECPTQAFVASSRATLEALRSATAEPTRLA
jgi:predicted dehydrogenase